MSRPGARRGGCSPPWNAASMSRDVAALRQHEPGRPAPRAPTLTGRASLNAVQSLLDYGAKLGVGLVVTPIVVTGLGRLLLGVWVVLNRHSERPSPVTTVGVTDRKSKRPNS